ECNLGDETGSIGSCTKNNKANPSRFQLEQDVHRLQQQLQEEMELHAILEMAIEKNAMKLSSSSRLPHQAQELLSNIALLEVTVSKLEQEMVSLHFQLSQERNERRLAEYRLRHSSFPSISHCSSDILDKSLVKSGTKDLGSNFAQNRDGCLREWEDWPPILYPRDWNKKKYILSDDIHALA
ncbi:isoform 2 of rho gtpase-activating protein 7, partial [Fagus crenata]